MASKKSKILAIAFCTAVMAGIHVTPAFAYMEHDYGYQNTKTESGLNNPEINHMVKDDWYENFKPAHPEGDVNCKEEVADSNITVGDLNKVTADLVENDETINAKVDKVADDVETLKEQVGKGDTDTHVKEGTYEATDDGNVTMDIVNKDGSDTGNDVTITGIASDKELAAETAAREEADKKLQGQIEKVESDYKAADEAVKEELNGNIEYVSGQIMDKVELEEAERKAADEKLQAGIDTEAAIREEADKKLQDNIDLEEAERKAADEKLQAGIDTEVALREAVTGVKDDKELKDTYANGHYISDAENMVDADMKLDQAVYEVNGRVDGLENRVDGLEDRIDKVGAMAAAIANLRTMGYDPAAPTEIAVGIGQYRDETGMALGLFHYPNRDFMLSLSVSTSGDEYMGGIGATWKFGRKSPEKVAEIKKAQAEADVRRAEEAKIAKAEEIKKAAKEAKVRAQMERHAKLAAERAEA